MMALWNVFRAPVLVMLRRTLPWHAVCVARASYKVLACSHIPPVRFQSQYRTSIAPTELQNSHQIRTTENSRWNLKESKKSRQYLWHVEARLTDGQLEYGSSSLYVSKDRLQLSKLDPGGAVLRAVLQVLLIELPAAVKLSELQLQLDVALKQLILWAFPNASALWLQSNKIIRLQFQ